MSPTTRGRARNAALPALPRRRALRVERAPSQRAGYSGTPLAKKLGISEGSRVCVRHAPAEYVEWLAPLPSNVDFQRTISPLTDLVHLFAHRSARLRAELGALRMSIRPDGAVWVSWPKKASKVATDITEDTVRELALPLGFVDVKVCALSDVWSGLKLVIRKELRR